MKGASWQGGKYRERLCYSMSKSEKLALKNFLTNRLKLVPLLIYVILAVIASGGGLIIGSGQASAVSGPVPIQQKPSNSSYISSSGDNALLKLAQNCHDIPHDPSAAVGSTLWQQCQGYQNRLKNDLGCSDSMFYQKADPNDNSAKLNIWYTDSAKFADCYSKAKSALDTIASDKCSDMAHGGSIPDSQNWKDCEAAQNSLHSTVGCSLNMFKKKDANHFTQDQSKVSSCQSNLSAVAAIHLIQPDGTTTSAVSNITPSQDSGGQKDLSCEGEITNPLTWILCPIINDVLVPLVDTIDGWITQELDVSSSTIFCNSGTCNNFYSAWSSFRDIALGLMVIAGLVVVIAQSLGLEVLDAYTLRKVLPRILIAAIGITLSWPLMKFAVDLSNALGVGIRNIIYFPFSHLGSSIDLSFKHTIAGGLGNFFFGTAGFLAAGLATIAMIGIILSLIATAALAVFIAISVLVLRQVAIIMLILIAPVAIVAYILPNTQKVYQFWWDSFSKALLMFPLIAAFIATGRVFSAVTLTNHDILSQVIGFLAYFAPYFLIPVTFRFAGGFVRQLGGFVNDRSRGAFDRLRQSRGNKFKQLNERRKAGELFEGKSWAPGSTAAANKINEAALGIGTGWRGRYGLGRRGKDARGYARQVAGNAAQQTEGMKAISGWNDVNRVLAGGMGDDAQGRQNLVEHLLAGGDDGKWGINYKTEEERISAANAQADRAVSAAKAAGRFTKANGIAAFNNMVRDGTAIRDTDDLAELAAIVGQGDRNSTFKYAAEGASISRQAGRSDLAAASEPIGALAFAHSDIKFNGGLYKPNQADAKADLDKLAADAWESGAGGEVSYTKLSTAKARTIRNDVRRAVDIVKKHREAIEAGQTSPYTPEQVQFAAASLVETQNAVNAQYGKLNNRAEAVKELGNDNGALEWYLDTPTTVNATARVEGPHPTVGGAPVYAEGPVRMTNRSVIDGIVGDRYAGMTPEQRKVAEQNRQQEDNDNP